MKDCIPWKGPHVGTGEQCDGERLAETTCCQLTATPVPCPLAPLGWEGGGAVRRAGNEGLKLRLGRRKGGGGER